MATKGALLRRSGLRRGKQAPWMAGEELREVFLLRSFCLRYYGSTKTARERGGVLADLKSNQPRIEINNEKD
jgi:hypothetical protein